MTKADFNQIGHVKILKLDESCKEVEKPFNPNEVQYDENGNVRLNKHGEPIRKVGRPPKDKSLMEAKKEEDAIKKSIKAKRKIEFRKLL